MSEREGHGELRRDLAERVELHRRRFLGLMAGGAGLIVLGACSDDESGGDGGRSGGASATTRSAATSTEPAAVPDAQGIESDPFTLGVASGDPTPASVILWTRLAPNPVAADGAGGMPTDDIEILWEVAGDEEFREIVASGVEMAVADFGHSVHVDPDGLEADTWYSYRFRVGDFTSPIGRTRTTPADDADVDELRIAFASCQLRQAGQWTAYDHMSRDELDVVFHLGDYIYEYPGGEGEDTMVPLEAEPQTIADYRVIYGAYKRDSFLQAAHARVPWVVTWDDHEVDNNYADDIPEMASDDATFAERRRAAYQAFYEHQPVRVDPPTDDGLRIHRTVRYGSLATFFVLDGRQYRSDQVCGDAFPTSASGCDALDDPENTMLGTDQEEWLISGLTESTTTWKALAQQTVMKALVLGDVVFNVDQWDGYPAARARLLDAIRDGEVDNVMVLTGDIHAGAAADIRGTDAGLEGSVVAHELVVPGISSPGFPPDAASGLDPAALGVLYANFTEHGYNRCAITPEAWTTEFVLVDTIQERESTSRIDATVEVRAGEPGLRML